MVTLQRGPTQRLLFANSPCISAIPPSFDDLGLHFFFTHYVTEFFNILPVLKKDGFSTPCSYGPALGDVVSSVGFAGLSNLTKNRKYMIAARKRYVTALGWVHDTLKSPSTVNAADTFKAIMMLAAFEVTNQTEIRDD
jgi:hypothetical protein